ncbi:PBP1A family penicillin-binding protein [Ideonella sp.]|jgi:penicillin-binding protein 1A|uniref:PBP1A family penicillin-binding protein n=1 Tax=Ideonella sp. TaxID=1929293 RepID=UPI0037BE83D7
MPAPSAPPAPLWRRKLNTLLLAVGLLGLLTVLAIAVVAAIYTPQLPALDKVTDYNPQLPLKVQTRDGVEIALFGAEKRVFVPIAQIPTRLQDAVLAVEDSRFREHRGIDFRGVARALFSNLTGGLRQGASTITQQVARNFFLTNRRTLERKIKEALLALKMEETLSKDQILELYMNQIYLGHRSYGFGAAAQVYFGKTLDQLSIAECAMLAGLPQNPAFHNPRTNFAKAQNRQRVVLMRMRDTGVITEEEHAAARAEVLKLRSALDVPVHAEYVAEMARLVVVERFGEAAYQRGLTVTTTLVAEEQRAAYAALRKSLMEHDRKQAWRGPEDSEDLPEDEAAAELAAGQLLKEHRDDEDLRVAIVMQASPKEVQARLATGELLRLNGDALRWVQPALAANAPKAIALKRGAIIRVAKAPKSTPEKPQWQVSQWPDVQGAFVALEPNTGRIRALVGGFDFQRQPFNHVTQAWRQPGSSFKPLLYSAALEQGLMPETLLNDMPLENVGNWDPQNSDGSADGPVTLRTALTKSKNLVSARVAQHMGVEPVRQWAERFGLDAKKQPDNLTVALGAGSVTPLQMAQAYGVLANGGWRVTPRVIERITDAKGQVLWEAPAIAPLLDTPTAAASSALSTDGTAEPAATAAASSPAELYQVPMPPPPAAATAASGAEQPAVRVIPARNAFITNSLLQEVTRVGTAAKAQAQLKRPDLYGKTGTTNDAVDAWFVGFQPSIAAAVWIGHDEPRSLGQRESGGGLALPVWIAYMEKALKTVPVQELSPPAGVMRADHDWRYVEWAEGGFVRSVGLPPPEPAASGASAPAPEDAPARPASSP